MRGLPHPSAERLCAPRQDVGGATRFKLCRECARRDKVQRQLGLARLEVDAIGEDGRALFSRQFHTPLFGKCEGFEKRTRAQIADELNRMQ